MLPPFRASSKSAIANTPMLWGPVPAGGEQMGKRDATSGVPLARPEGGMLSHRIGIFVNLPLRALSALVLQRRLDDIGRDPPPEA